MNLLAIESSCDETSASIISNGELKSNVISSQYFHKNWGGVVPELASRAHLEYISQITLQALNEAKISISQVNALAVTTEPGLAGSLIVGANFVKGLALRYNLPVVPVNHIEGHIFSSCLQSQVEFPYIALVVSGGHTSLFIVESFNSYKVIGSTVDDAAGEAFDKIATMLGLPYPGGPEIDKLAKSGNPQRFNFPRSMQDSPDFNFSFSGLKTSVRYFLAKNYPDGVNERDIPDLCASVQAAIVEVLVYKTIKAAKKYGVKQIAMAGGVSANSELKAQFMAASQKHSIEFASPGLNLCMDNAAMIAFAAEKKFSERPEDFHNLSFTVSANAIRAKRK